MPELEIINIDAQDEVTMRFSHEGRILSDSKVSGETLGAALESMTQKSGVLPPAVRWISQTGRFAIFERPPHEVTIDFYGVELAKVAKARQQRFTLPLPWTVYAVELDLSNRVAGVSLFARGGPILTTNDRLYLLPLPNLYDDGRFCLRPFTESGGDLSTAMVSAYNEVWDSDFNLDVIRTVEHAYEYRQPAELFASVPADVRRYSAASMLAHWERFELSEITSWEHWVPCHWGHDADQQEYDEDGNPLHDLGVFTVERLIHHLTRADEQYYSSPTFFINTLRMSLQ